MAIFSIYDAAGTGFNMPAATANSDVTIHLEFDTLLEDTPPTDDFPGQADYSGTFDWGNEIIFNYYHPDAIHTQMGNASFYLNGDPTLDVDIDPFYYNWDTATLLGGGNLTFRGLTNDPFDVWNGDSFADIIHGGLGVDTEYGNGGNDHLFGDSGNDTLYGGANNDFLIGGVGRDVSIGGAGLDRFDFDSTLESRVGSQHDVVSDFHRSQHDRVDLSTIDAYTGKAGNQAFVFIGDDTFAHFHSLHPTVFGMVRYAGGNVQANTNGNLAADMEIHVNGAGASMLATDFVL